MNYITVQGDMWDVISKKVYGNEFHTDVLIKANPQHSAIFIFSSGVELALPEIETTIEFEDLPPWKRG